MLKMNISTLNINFTFQSDGSSTMGRQPRSSNSRANPSQSLYQFLNSLLRREGSYFPEEMSVIVGIEPASQSSSTNQESPSINTFESIHENSTLFVYTDEENPLPDCSICHSAFSNNDICRKINACQHSFHQSCIDSWLNQHNTCPLCRTSIY